MRANYTDDDRLHLHPHVPHRAGAPLPEPAGGRRRRRAARAGARCGPTANPRSRRLSLICARRGTSAGMNEVIASSELTQQPDYEVVNHNSVCVINCALLQLKQQLLLCMLHHLAAQGTGEGISTHH